MKAFLYYIAVVFLFVINKLPFCVLYLLSDMLYFLMYYVVRYRRKVVRENLVNSFPDKSLKEIRSIESKFYHRLCDFFLEIIKLHGMSENKVREHMRFVGMEAIKESIENGHSCTVYIGHMFNWEYMNSVSLYLDLDKVFIGEVYHVLRNRYFDSLMKRVRGQYGAEPIPMKDTLRRIVQAEKDGKLFLVGFVADQLPKWEAIKHWVKFLNQDTPVFIGTEKIARRTRSAIFYTYTTRLKRGYYEIRVECLAKDASQLKEFEATELYYKRLEANIMESPELWLWTHKRWKRTREGFEERERHRRETLKQMSKEHIANQ